VSSFPVLRSGKSAQYPSEFEFETETGILRFVDGSEQRYPVRRRRRRWVLRYRDLDEGELRLLEEFVIAQSGGSGTFAFTDPETGVIHPACRLDARPVVLRSEGRERNAVEITVVEVTE
jgi:phage-related protein